MRIESLLEAAKAVFGTSGVDAPAKEIADLAGVGVGTLYRHFPQRSDLVKAVFQREVDACADAAPALTAAHEPGVALAKWLHRYTEFLATKRGLATALHSGDPAFDALPGYFMQRLGPTLGSLLEAARASGEIRADISPKVARVSRPSSRIASRRSSGASTSNSHGIRAACATSGANSFAPNRSTHDVASKASRTPSPGGNVWATTSALVWTST
jgi:AcrR family transcriptional regulator